MKIVESGATHNTEEAYLAYDRVPGTRWTSKEPQSSTMAFWVVLDAPAMISGVTVTTEDATDNPRQWTVAIMDSTGGHGRKEIAKGEGEIRLAFPPVRGQVIRIEQTGGDPEMWWSIHQLNVTGETITTEPPPVIPPVVSPNQPIVVVCDPTQFDEGAARSFIAAWAQLFGWWYYQEERKDFAGLVTRVNMHIMYPLLRQKTDEPTVLEPWPFTT